MILSDAFSKEALSVAPRILGLCDRDLDSPTFGCCDRTYWHYRLLDVANARYQEAGLLLALLYVFPFPSLNLGYQNPALRRWIEGIWRFWLKQRNRDGSVNEVYPFERSFCATSFSTAAFIQTIALTGGATAWQRELDELQPTLFWLSQHYTSDTANQMAASLLALMGYAQLTNDKKFEDHAQRRLNQLLQLAREDGVFPEYGGLDVGYQTITMGQLAHICRIKRNDQIQDILVKSERLLSERIDATGRVDSAANSRNTQFVYPFAFATLQSSIVDRLQTGLGQRQLLCPSWMDDRYCIPLTIDYLMTSEEFLKQ